MKTFKDYLTEAKLDPFEVDGKKIKVGDTISFNEASNSPKLKGKVEYKDQLGYITKIGSKIYELKKLMNIQKVK